LSRNNWRKKIIITDARSHLSTPTAIQSYAGQESMELGEGVQL